MIDMTKVVEAYFASIDRQDLPATLATLSPACTIEYVTDGSRFIGRDDGVKAYFEKRNAGCEKSWHGDFFHVADAAAARVATRFKVRRTDRGVPERHGDNINVFEFDGALIKRISVWRGVPVKG
jgi:limonene-1,2-epoxide hydrolase